MLFARRGSSGPQDLPRPGPSPRHARPARRVPAGDRRSVRPRLRAWGDAESVYPVQRRLPVRRAAHVRSTSRRPAVSRRGTTLVRRNTREGCCWRGRPTPRRISRTCSRGSTRLCSSGSGFRSASRRRTRRGPRRLGQGWRQRGGRRARRRVFSVETTTAPSSGAGAFARPRGRSWTRQGRFSAATTATGASLRASGAGSASPPASPCTR